MDNLSDVAEISEVSLLSGTELLVISLLLADY